MRGEAMAQAVDAGMLANTGFPDGGCAIGAEMQPGELIAKANVGPLNFVFGFSIGSSKALVWRPDREGRRGQITMRGTKHTALRCGSCGTILLKTER